MNMVHVIHPYRTANKQWVFDDVDYDLFKEPLVTTHGLVLDLIVGDEEKCNVLFSTKEFPKYEFILKKTGDNTYTLNVGKKKLFVAPWLYNYYNESPEKIYLRIIVIKDNI